MEFRQATDEEMKDLWLVDSVRQKLSQSTGASVVVELVPTGGLNPNQAQAIEVGLGAYPWLEKGDLHAGVHVLLVGDRLVQANVDADGAVLLPSDSE
jgi:hypothetical protein